MPATGATACGSAAGTFDCCSSAPLKKRSPITNKKKKTDDVVKFATIVSAKTRPVTQT